MCVSDECLDLLHELMIEVQSRLVRRASRISVQPVDPVRYAASMVPSVLTDRARIRRVRMGFAAKPGRADGRAMRVNVRLQEIATSQAQASWFVALFRILRDYAHTEGRASAVWPLAGLAMERARYDGGPAGLGALAAEREIRLDIRTVLNVATEVAGEEWVSRLIWQPLVSGVMATELPDDERATDSSMEGRVLTAGFRAEYLSCRTRGLPVQAAFHAAARVVGGNPSGGPDADVLALLEDIEEQFRLKSG